MKIHTKKIAVGSSPAGTELNLEYTTLDSGKKGKTVYIQSGMHGGEITYWIAKRLFDYAEKHLKHGKIVFLPYANPVAWLQRIYFSTPGKFDLYMGTDWNRNYPGNLEGTLGERIAANVFALATKADLVIDLHTSRKSFPFNIVFTQEDLFYAKLTGIEYTYFKDLSKNKNHQYWNTLSGQLMQKGIRNLTIECGSHDSYEPEYIDLVTTGIKNILITEGLISGTKKSFKNLKHYDKLNTYKAPKAGLVRFIKQVGDKYKAGEALFEVYSQIIDKPEIVYARENGIVEKQSPTHIYWSGDDVLETIPLDSIYKLI